jgi:trigger factor
MAEEKEPETTEAAEGTTTVAETAAEAPAEAPAAEGEEKKDKLRQDVLITEVGPCRKHIKVTVDRSNIDELFNEKVAELVGDSHVPGFRPGKAPRQVVVRKFQKDIGEQIKSQVLMASLEQLAEDHDIAPLSAPNINPNKLEIPKDGPFIYEFEVEVRPQFDLPDYKGLKLKRPVKTFTDADAEKEEKRILARFGQLVPKPKGNAEDGDYLIADMTTRHEGKELGTAKEITLRIDDRLAFRDGVADRFGEQVEGAKAGDTRTIDITLADNVAAEALRGQKVQATLEVKDVKTMRLPELTHEFLHNFGVHTPEQLREWVRTLLDRRLEYQQRQSAREQVMQHIAASATWELPQDLLVRQARKALARRVMEMRESGMSEEDIRARQRLLQQDILNSTALSLKEHFVLQKIAEVEKVDVNDDEINDEIERIADQTGESPRRVRSQLEKDDMIETLAAQLIERKALDQILASAEYEDVPLEPERAVGAAEAQAVTGELRDPTEAPPEGEAAEAQAGGTSPTA